MTILTWILTGFVLVAAPPVPLAERLKPMGAVSDFARVLTAAERLALEQLLGEVRAKTSAEIAVVTIPSLEEGQVDDVANRLFEAWGIGKKGEDNGVLLLAAIADRKVRIEVGYGLEGLLPDARVGRLLDEQVLPEFRNGRIGAGLLNGTRQLADIIGRDAGLAATNIVSAATEPAAREPRAYNAGGILFPAIFIVFISVFFIAALRGRRSRAGKKSSGGGGSDGGGSSSGSSDSGGGSDSGFGGGSSGGGGAGRGW